MNVMILKIHEPHGWVTMDDLLKKDNALVGVKGMAEIISFCPFFRFKEDIDFDTLQRGIQYHFNNHPNVNKLIILTENIEEENLSLIEMLKQVKINEVNYISCIVICNSF